MTIQISTPRPPLNIFEASRKELIGNDYVTLLDVPQYFIPAVGPTAARTVNACAIMTGLTITNIHDADINVSARIKGQDGNYYTVINSAPIPTNDFLYIGFERQVLLTGETMEVACNTGDVGDNFATVHFSYIINQREEFVINS